MTHEAEVENTSRSAIEPEPDPVQPEHTNESFVDTSSELEAEVRTQPRLQLLLPDMLT